MLQPNHKEILKMQIESSKEIYKLIGGNEFFSEYIKAYSFGENSYDGWATFMFDGCETCNRCTIQKNDSGNYDIVFQMQKQYSFETIAKFPDSSKTEIRDIFFLMTGL